MEKLHCTRLQKEDIWRFAVSSKTNEVQDEYTVRSMRIPRWKKNLNWLAVCEAVKLIEGVHFHYQLRSAYEHRSHKPVPKCDPASICLPEGEGSADTRIDQERSLCLCQGWAYADCVQLLIGSGADVNAHDEREEIPEDKAKKWEMRTQCLKML